MTTNVTRGDIIQRITVNGTLNPLKIVNVGTQVSGTVQKLYADYNQKVQEGQVLAEIDPALFKSQLTESKAALVMAQAKQALSQKTYQRTKKLLEKDYVARQDLDAALQDLQNSDALVEQAQAQVKRDEVNLAYTVIHSPVSGVVISRDVDVGQTMAASFQTPELFKIAQDLKQMQITPGSYTTGGVRSAAGKMISLSLVDARALKSLPEITAVAPMFTGLEQLIAGRENWNTVVIGTTSDILSIRGLEIEAGDMFIDDDGRSEEHAIVLGKTVADKLFPNGEDPLGNSVTINTLSLRVIGVLKSRGQSAGGYDQDDMAIVPLKIAQRQLFGSSVADSVQQIGVSVQSVLQYGRDAQTICELLEHADKMRAFRKPEYEYTGPVVRPGDSMIITEIQEDYVVRNFPEALAWHQLA